MAGEERILFISMVTILSLNLVVAPLVDEGQSFTIPDLEPPEQAVISDDFDVPTIDVEDDTFESITGALGEIVNLFITAISWLVGILISIVWLIWALVSIIFSGSYAHPLLTVLNILIGITALVSIVKILSIT